MASPEVVESSGGLVPGGVSEELFAIEGWKKKLMLKKGGTPKKKDVVYVAPNGEEIRNKRQLEKYLKNNPGGPSLADFDWSTGETPRRSARLSSKGRLSSDSAEAEPAVKRSKLDEDEVEEEDAIVVVSPRKSSRKKAAPPVGGTGKEDVTEETGKGREGDSFAADDADAKVANDKGAPGVDETLLNNNADGKHGEEGIASAIEEVNPGNSADQVKAEEQALKIEEPLTVTDIVMGEVPAVEGVSEVGEGVILQQPAATSVELPTVEEVVKPTEGETSLKQDEEVKKEVSQDVLDVPTTEQLDGTNDDPLKPKDHIESQGIHAFIEQQTEHSLPAAERVGTPSTLVPKRGRDGIMSQHTPDQTLLDQHVRRGPRTCRSRHLKLFIIRIRITSALGLKGLLEKLGTLNPTGWCVTRQERRGRRRPKSRRLKKLEETNSIRREDSSGMDTFTCRVTNGFWDPTDSSHVQAVKKALHLSEVPDIILCRDEEQAKVINFCKACVMEQRAGSIYICGCPGTGKSLTVEKVKSLCASWSKQAGTMHPEMVAINCTSLTDPKQVYLRVLQALKPSHINEESKNSKDVVMKELKQLMCYSTPSSASSKRMLLLILDEMDYLITRDQSVLYDLFRLPTLSNSRLVLIGIANAIDLTDRLLPKLRSMNCKVDAITFPTYTKDQILSVLQQRLKGLRYCVFQPAALELCARKVAAATGDMRKALHVCRSAVELVEAQADAAKSEDQLEQDMESITIRRAQQSSVVSSDSKRKMISEQEAALVQIDVMARVLSRTFCSPVVETIQSLPRHQQIVLCAAVRSFRRGKKDSSVGELNTAYLEFCKLTGMQPLTPPEFSSVCQVLADQALLSLGISREERLRRVTLKVDQEDIIFALQGVRFLRTCL